MYIVGLHITLRVDAFRGRGQASSGRHDVGHKGVATRCGVPSLYSYVTPAGFRASRMLVTKALSHDVTILAFVPLSLIPLESPPFIPCAFLSDKKRVIVELKKYDKKGVQFVFVTSRWMRDSKPSFLSP